MLVIDQEPILYEEDKKIITSLEWLRFFKMHQKCRIQYFEHQSDLGLRHPKPIFQFPEF